MKEKAIALLSVTIFLLVFFTSRFGNAEIQTMMVDVQEAASMREQALTGNDEALIMLSDLAEQRKIPYMMAIAFLETTDENYARRDELIWNALHQANSLESAYILREFDYLYDNSALARVVSQNLMENGQIHPVALNAIRVTLSDDKVRLMRVCRSRLDMLVKNDKNIFENDPANFWFEKLTRRKGVCFQQLSHKA